MLKIYNGENPPTPITRARHAVKLYGTCFSEIQNEELAGIIAQEISDAVQTERNRCAKLIDLELESIDPQFEMSDPSMYVAGWRNALERLKVKFND